MHTAGRHCSTTSQPSHPASHRTPGAAPISICSDTCRRAEYRHIMSAPTNNAFSVVLCVDNGFIVSRNMKRTWNQSFQPLSVPRGWRRELPLWGRPTRPHHFQVGHLQRRPSSLHPCHTTCISYHCAYTAEKVSCASLLTALAPGLSLLEAVIHGSCGSVPSLKQ